MIDNKTKGISPVLLMSTLVSISMLIMSVATGYTPLSTILSFQLHRSSSPDDLSGPIAALELNNNNCYAMTSLLDRLSNQIDSSDQQQKISIANDIIELSQINPECWDSESNLNIGKANAIVGNHTEAIIFFKAYIEYPSSFPTGVDGYIYLADEYDAISDYRRALRYLLIAASQYPYAEWRPVAAKESLGHIYLPVPHQDYQTKQSLLVRANSYLEEYPQLSESLITTSSTIGFGRYPSIAIDTFGNVHVVNQSSEYPSLLVHQVANSDGLVLRQILSAGENTKGSIAIDDSNTVHFAYTISDRLIGYSNTYKSGIVNVFSLASLYDDLYQYSPSTRTVFVPAIRDIKIVADAKGNPHIVWSAGWGSIQDSMIGYSTIGNTEVLSTSIIQSSGKSAPDIVSYENGIGVTFNDAVSFPTSGSSVYFMELRNGQEWDSLMKFGNPSDWSGASAIISDTQGVLHLVYLSGTTQENIKLKYVSRNRDKQWAESITISNDETRPWIPLGDDINFRGRTSPSLIISGNYLVIMWRGTGDSFRTPIIVRSLDIRGGKWLEPEIIGSIEDVSPSSFVFSPSFALNLSESVYVFLPTVGALQEYQLPED